MGNLAARIIKMIYVKPSGINSDETINGLARSTTVTIDDDLYAEVDAFLNDLLNDLLVDAHGEIAGVRSLAKLDDDSLGSVLLFQFFSQTKYSYYSVRLPQSGLVGAKALCLQSSQSRIFVQQALLSSCALVQSGLSFQRHSCYVCRRPAHLLK